MTVWIFAIVPYQFPMLEMGLFFLALFGLEFLLSARTAGRQRKRRISKRPAFQVIDTRGKAPPQRPLKPRKRARNLRNTTKTNACEIVNNVENDEELLTESEGRRYA